MLGQNTLEWLGVDSSKYLNNMDRENRLSEQIIMSKTHAKLAGKYVCTSPENVNLTLEMEDAKFTWENTETGVTKEGKWEVGTYTRQGDVNKDVNLIFKQSDDNDGKVSSADCGGVTFNSFTRSTLFKVLISSNVSLYTT